jgi:hypothetical protein
MHTPFPSQAALDVATFQVVALARVKGIGVHKIELVTTSEAWDKNLGVLFAYETDAELVLRNSDGTSEWLKSEFAEALDKCKLILPFSKMPEHIDYSFDSQEHIVRNFKGSYFLRLR